MKKILTMILILSLVVMSAINASASEMPGQIIIESEYDSIQYYARLSKHAMKVAGLSQMEIAEIESYKKNYADNIIMYANKSPQELKKLGFSATQIDAFHKLYEKELTLDANASSTEVNLFLKENVTRGLTGSVSMSVRASSAEKGKNTFKATWRWDGRPIVVGFHDTIAFGWTNGHTLAKYDDLVATLMCTSSTDVPNYKVPNKDKNTIVADEAVRFKFPTASNGGWLYDQGTCYFTLLNDDNASTTTISWMYAHGTVQITGFGISLSGGSLSVSVGSTQMANGLKRFTGLI